MIMETNLDKNKVRRSFAAAALSYDGVAELQRRVGLEMLQRFPVRRSSGVLLDVGCGTGFLTRQLATLTPDQCLIALDLALPMLQTCRRKYPELAAQYLCADAENLPFAPHGVAQIYSNLALQWAQDLAATLAGFKRALRPEGRLVFTTFGPATLCELKAAWAAVDSFTHVNTFHTVGEIEAFLKAAGFRGIGVDRVLYRSSYPSVQALMRELKGIGAHNVNRRRNLKPTTKTQLQQMIGHYQSQMGGGEIVASYEIIFVKAQS